MISDREAVFLEFGKVSYIVQTFEADLTNLLIILKMLTEADEQIKTSPESMLNRRLVESWWLKTAKNIEGKLNKQTLGTLLRRQLQEATECLERMQKEGSNVIPTDILRSINKQLKGLPISEWNKALNRRNDLFHEFFYRNDEQLGNAAGCYILLEELAKDKRLFEKCISNVRETFKDIMKFIGYDLSNIEYPH